MLETHQPYNVIQRTHDIEYRRYPGATVAQVRVRGSYTIRLHSGFRELSHYVTGGNYQHQSLPMIAPVVMTPLNTDESHVRLYLGTDSQVTTVPTPLSHAVEIMTHAPLIVAAIRMAVACQPSVLQDTALRLRQTLMTANIAFVDVPEYRFYTSPWQPLGHHGEVTFRLTQLPFPLV
jgi:hypothetical protein